MIRTIVFESNYRMQEKSGLVAEPEIIKIRLCMKCTLNFARTQLTEISKYQIWQLAGLGRPKENNK